MSTIDIYGIGNPLIDIIAPAGDDDLQILGLDKGIMRLVDLGERAKILNHIQGREISYSCGGSCPNTMIFLSALGTGTALAGKIGTDDFGERYADNLPEANLTSQLKVGSGATGSSIILVSPDSERTMNTYLGANREFSREDMDGDVVSRARFLYFTGYMWDTEPQKNAVLSAIDICKSRGGTVVFDVADPFAVDRNLDEFRRLIHEKVDIVFANREEAKLLFGTESAQDAARRLADLCELAIVKDGSAGSYVSRNGSEQIHIPARVVHAVDTTGAGDMYAAGFLYGVCSGMGDRDAGICASYLASRIVETWGAQFLPGQRKEIAAEVTSGEWRYTS